MAEFLTIEHFRPRVGQRFIFQGTPFVMTLDRVLSNGKPLVAGAQRIAFNLIFAGPKDHVLLEGVYSLETEDGRVWPVHVMPIHTARPDAQEYQALFD